MQASNVQTRSPVFWGPKLNLMAFCILSQCSVWFGSLKSTSKKTQAVIRPKVKQKKEQGDQRRASLF